jgi:hypothetical protein
MKIRSQIIIVSFLLVVVSVACTSITAMRYFIDYMKKSAKEEAEYSIAGFEENIHADMERTRAFRDRLIENPELARLVSEKDTEGKHGHIGDGPRRQLGSADVCRQRRLA